LEREFVVVIPVLGGSPQSCSDGLPLFSARSFAVERNTFVIESHVVQVDISAWQESEWVDCIGGPKTLTMVGWIVKIVVIFQCRSDGKQVNSPIALYPSKPGPIDAAPDIATITSRDEILRSKRNLLPPS